MRMWQESYDGIGSQLPGVLFEQGEMAILFRRNCNTAKFRAIVCQKNISRLNSAVLPQHFRGLIKRTSPDRVS